MSERLPENTRYSHQLARRAGAAAAAALPSAEPPWEPRAPTVAERAARADVVKPAPERGPRGPIGPSGTGPSLEEAREELKRLQAAAPKRKRCGGVGLFGDDPPSTPGAYGKPAVAVADPGLDELRRHVEAIHARHPARAVVAAIASEVMAPERRKLERYETAIRRAIGLIQPTGGSFVGTQPMHALAVLRECLIPESDDTLKEVTHEDDPIADPDAPGPVPRD